VTKCQVARGILLFPQDRRDDSIAWRAVRRHPVTTCSTGSLGRAEQPFRLSISVRRNKETVPDVSSEPPREGGEIVQLRDVRKTFGNAHNNVVALNGVSLGFRPGTFTAVMGPSGSGKSTFMNCAAGLEKPDSGSVVLDGRELTELGEGQLVKLRRERIGFVFQALNLMSALTVKENVELPLRLSGRPLDRTQFGEILERVGLGGKGSRRPAELSGGQQQRVAIARALITRPAVIFGDEPTGALDTTTAAEILQLLREAVRDGGRTVVMVTHDPVAASHADRVVFLADGNLAGELANPTPREVAARLSLLGAPHGGPAGGAGDLPDPRDAGPAHPHHDGLARPHRSDIEFDQEGAR
jgi:putative ABC transport system ATP-binding protein